MASQGAPVPFLESGEATIVHPLQYVDKCVWGSGLSFIGKNPLAKPGFSCFGKAIQLDISYTDPRHRTDTKTQTGSQHLTSTRDCNRHSTKVAPRTPGAWDSRNSAGRLGETDAPLGSQKRKVQAEVGDVAAGLVGHALVPKFPDRRRGLGAPPQTARERGGAGTLG